MLSQMSIDLVASYDNPILLLNRLTQDVLHW